MSTDEITSLSPSVPPGDDHAGLVPHDELVLHDGLPLASVSAEHLEHQMLTLSGHLAAATCSFLLLVGEYDERRSWESWECLSCAHWLNWRCGVGMVAAREQVRVARRLRELPLVRDAFAQGRISYSKVRAITRVAHPEIEAKLVDLARWSTAAQLERACSALRRCADAEEAERELCEEEDRAELRRSVRWHHDPDTGDLIVRLRIPAGVAAESFRASVDALAQKVGTTPGDTAESEPDELECRRLDAVLDLVSAGSGCDSSLAPQAEVVVHVTAAAAPSPADPVVEGVGAAVATQGGQLLPRCTLEQLCCDAGLRTVLDLVAFDPTAFDVTALDLAAIEAELLTSLDLGRHRRFPSPALRRAVHRRDRGCCRFPGCDRRHRLHVHHIIPWEVGGRTDRANLLLLCPKHHRAVHRGTWTLTGPADRAVFRRNRELVSSGAPPLQGQLAELVDGHRRHGLDIAADGAGSHWQGDHIDWDCFFAALAPQQWGDGPDDSAESPLSRPASSSASPASSSASPAPWDQPTIGGN
jgi:hypothetical protein